MPIKPENRERYPKDWPAISRAARERAGWRCQHQGCAARQYSVGVWHRPGGGDWKWLAHWGDNDNPRTYDQARQVAADESFTRFGDGPPERGDQQVIVIVLTVAHLNHEPEDCRPENLAAMCQRHHLAYDAEHHKQTAYATRKAAARTPDLFA